jgi:hypothetical protein
MKHGILCFTIMAFMLSFFIFLPQNVSAEDARAFVPDKARCSQMIQFGKQSYQRGKFLDAKEYFRMALQADSASSKAWRHYDLAVISALAEKVNKNMGLIVPDVSMQGPAEAQVAAPPSLAPKPAPDKFAIPEEEEEGC